MNLNIQIIESGTQIGVKVRNTTNYYDREDVETYSTSDGLVGLRLIESQVIIVEEHPTEYLIPKEASVKDLVVLIKDIINFIPVYTLTEDELEAIKNSNNPSSSNPFATVVDSITPAEKSKLATIETGATMNSSDTVLLDRANHTGTQTSSTISDFAATVISAILTGFSTGAASSILDTDTILQAFGKAQGQIDNIITTLTGKQDISEKGNANGYGSLDANGLQPITERQPVFITSIEDSRIITPATLTATANDYAPTGYETSDILRQEIDANNREITGLVAPAVGVNRIIGICNINTSGNDLRFTNNDAGSLIENRFLLRDDADRSLKPNETAFFWYDHTSSKWRPCGRIG